MRLLSWVFGLMILAGTVMAAPVAYLLNEAETKIEFAYDFGSQEISGRIPVASADIVLDLIDYGQSSIVVVLDPTQAVAGFPFATEAMRGPKVLDTRQFPTIRFESSKIVKVEGGAQVTGQITVRDVTAPITLDAKFFRQRGTDENDRDHLAIIMTGALNRSAFGASGYKRYVGDELRLKITALIDKK